MNCTRFELIGNIELAIKPAKRITFNPFTGLGASSFCLILCSAVKQMLKTRLHYLEPNDATCNLLDQRQFCVYDYKTAAMT